MMHVKDELKFFLSLRWKKKKDKGKKDKHKKKKLKKWKNDKGMKKKWKKDKGGGKVKKWHW